MRRFRLEKKNRGAKVYYLDAGIPEPIPERDARRHLWWKAFEAAGFRHAIEVRDPTPDMDPMDIRYNFVFWSIAMSGDFP